VFTVPAFPTAQIGRIPAARSASIIRASAPTSTVKSSRTGACRRQSEPRPSSSTAFWMEL
jgi:hypothetical protein